MLIINRFAMVLVLVGLYAATARADATKVYRVSGVEVEARASTAVFARRAAILDGHAEALRRLLRRLTLPEDWPNLPALSGKDAQLLSVGYVASEEKNSTTRYIGRISVRFDPERIRRLLKHNNIPFGDVQISPALVIPVYDLPNGRRVVWENQNIWRQAWSRPDIGESLTPFILPVGDIEDIITLPSRAAQRENRKALFRIAARYNAQRVLLAHARLVQVNVGGQRGYALGVTLDVLSPGDGEADEQVAFSVSGSNRPKQLMNRGVNDILSMTGIAWKRRVIVHHDEVGQREVVVSFESLQEWGRLRKKLDNVSILKKYEVRRIDGHSALLAIDYSGSPDILALALAQQNVDLIFSKDDEDKAKEDDLWQIRLRK